MVIHELFTSSTRSLHTLGSLRCEPLASSFSLLGGHEDEVALEEFESFSLLESPASCFFLVIDVFQILLRN